MSAEQSLVDIVFGRLVEEYLAHEEETPVRAADLSRFRRDMPSAERGVTPKAVHAAIAQRAVHRQPRSFGPVRTSKGCATCSDSRGHADHPQAGTHMWRRSGSVQAMPS